MATQGREQRFNQSLRDWGHIFMLTVWLQSIMAAAIARKNIGSSRIGTIINPDPEYFERRNCLMKKEMSSIWDTFKSEFSNSITREEELVADMIILIRNQLVHSFISTGREFALFLPKPSSQKLLDKLKNAGWIETPRDAASSPEMLIFARRCRVVVQKEHGDDHELLRKHNPSCHKSQRYRRCGDMLMK